MTQRQWKDFETFREWLNKLSRIQECIWESDWGFAIKFDAHGLIGQVADWVIKRDRDGRKELPA